ncbi:VPS10 domain-containing protein [Aegicerativicinus sediminis]|uniref:VPS10 domain-containing protein n=1 Tax=Aegicerativicinus sediminis TaxID=2893202 RepID=UPI001E65596D|nr:glycosyl hydrolase [Aegicerativicinus sediminis]
MKQITLLILICSTLSLPLSGQSKRKQAKQANQSKSILTDSIYHNLKWRNIGPFRGGRSVACTGVIGNPQTYYFGSTGGGLWKTTDAGTTWKNISDGYFKTGSVGAVSVSESNPNVVIVGMGEHAARGVMTSMGDGVYKSMDAGKTWKHIGLDNSRHISDIIIHPKNPDIILVSVQGAQFGPSSDRGVYKTIDGGKSWSKTLYIDDITGASALSMDMTNPTILYASMWQHERKPWTITSGGKNSGLYKSTDGGDTWEKLSKGLPEEFGKSGISVSRANPERIFAVLEAEGEKAGVYRSDDAGKTWKQINKDRINITRSWYYMEIFADPINENTVYVLNAPVMKSIDGGRSFQNVPVPHGDTHDLWINPYDNTNYINSNDGGANITFNDGKSWSTQTNQPTSQFYRVITDNQIPYRIYGGQQDNSSVIISSASKDGEIGWKDWIEGPGCESAFLAFDPDNPEIVYGGCYQGIIERINVRTKVSKSIKEYPELALSKAPVDFKFRFNWNAPIISSPHDRNTIYHAGNRVFKTTDTGLSWSIISPDLTRNEKDKQGPGGGPYTNEAAGGENYNTIMYLVESTHEKGVLYTGSDDGLVHLTKDGGANWENITPKNLPEGIINSIEISPHDKATAYIVLMRYKFMDLAPYVYKTTDYGKSWKKIVNGLNEPHSFPRVVREDPNVKGVLYAGTETGLFVSTDDGNNWSKFQLNLPIVPINDLIFKDSDLVAATAGRSFWILDNVSGTQLRNGNGYEEVTLFQPKNTYRIRYRGNSEPQNFAGSNPNSGVSIDYFIPEGKDTLEVTIDILIDNKVIRSYSNKENKEFKTWVGGPSKPKPIPTKVGFNRIQWDFMGNDLPGVNGVFVYGDYQGHSYPPGNYSVRISLNEERQEKSFTLLPNPKIDTTAKDFEEQQSYLSQIDDLIRKVHDAVNAMRSVRSQLKDDINLLETEKSADSLVRLGQSLVKRIDEWEKNLIQPDQKTFQDVINFNNKLNAELMYLKGSLDEEDPRVTKGSKDRFEDLKKEWLEVKKEHDNVLLHEMSDYNKLYKQLELPALILKN